MFGKTQIPQGYWEYTLNTLNIHINIQRTSLSLRKAIVMHFNCYFKRIILFLISLLNYVRKHQDDEKHKPPTHFLQITVDNHENISVIEYLPWLFDNFKSSIPVCFVLPNTKGSLSKSVNFSSGLMSETRKQSFTSLLGSGGNLSIAIVFVERVEK